MQSSRSRFADDYRVRTQYAIPATLMLSCFAVPARAHDIIQLVGLEGNPANVAPVRILKKQKLLEFKFVKSEQMAAPRMRPPSAGRQNE